MADYTTLARPYAKAAFDHAREQNAIPAWEAFLELAQQVAIDASFVAVLHNPNFAARKKGEILADICLSGGTSNGALNATGADSVEAQTPALDAAGVMSQNHTADASFAPTDPVRSPANTHLDLAKNGNSERTAMQNFLLQLAENDRLPLLPAIAKLFNELKRATLKQVDAYVTSAYPLSDAQRVLLQNSLAVREQAVVILHEAVDADLLGGATIKVGDKFTDGSVKGKLAQLKTQLL